MNSDLKQAINLLKDGGIENPKLDAEVLLAHVLNKDRIQLYIYPDYVLNDDENSRYRALIDKRLARIPVSYLTGHKEFMSLDFRVDNVLIPRPETEVLVETVCKLGDAGSKVLDLGTGSGAIAVSLARYNPDWSILATDISMDALLIARENASRHNVTNQILFIQTDLFDGVSPTYNFDWIVSNPPYIPTGDLANLPDEVKNEPIIALNGGTDGLDVIRRIIKDASVYLKPYGCLAIEIGYGHSESIQKIADETGKYTDYSIIKDYSGIPRIFCCKSNDGSRRLQPAEKT